MSNIQPSIVDRFRNLSSWKRDSEEAPHKPLLILYALGRWHTTRTVRIPFADVDRDLTLLLQEYGPERSSYHAEYPFWWLQSDGIWEVHSSSALETRKGSNDPKKSELLHHNATGGFTDSIFAVLYADPGLVFNIAQAVLVDRFPSEQHLSILSRVGLATPTE